MSEAILVHLNRHGQGANRRFEMPTAFQPADLPPKPRGFWKLAGPGAVLVGLSIGAGELIVWPRNTA